MVRLVFHAEEAFPFAELSAEDDCIFHIFGLNS